MTYRICPQRRQGFTFYVDAWGTIISMGDKPGSDEEAVGLYRIDVTGEELASYFTIYLPILVR